MLATFSANATRLLTSSVFLQQSEFLYRQNKSDKEFRELKQQNQNGYSGWSKLLVKKGATVTLLIISAVFPYFQLNFWYVLEH